MRKNARLSGSVSDPQQKAMLRNMADTWESLAVDRERREAQRQRIVDLEGTRLIGNSGAPSQIPET
jgi:hypothetical protein